MNGHGKGDAVDVGRYLGQVDLDRLVIAVAFTGTVVARVLNRAVNAFELVVKNEIGVSADFSVSLEQESARIQVEVLTIGGASIPAQTHEDFGHPGGFFGQRQVAAFGKGKCHV